MTAWRRGRYYSRYCVRQWGILSPRIAKGAHGALPPGAQGHEPAGVCVRDGPGEPVRRALKGQRRAEASPADAGGKRGLWSRERRKEGVTDPVPGKGGPEEAAPEGHVPPAGV